MIVQKNPVKILVIDDEKAICDILCASLADDGFVVDQSSDGQSGLAKIRSFAPDLVLLDIWMPGQIDGLEVLRQAKTELSARQFIIMSGHGTIETAVKAVRLGAWDFVEKPLSMEKISILIQNVLAFQEEQKEKRTLLNRLRENIALIGDSKDLKVLKQMISRVAQSDSWVLISGEKGTGKSLVAQNIHYLSQRAGQSFVEFNCLSTPKELLEVEIFGGSSGAGADFSRRGKVDIAAGGTLLIDEIGELPLELQERILRILQDRRFCRAGSESFIETNVRVIASTSVDLQDLVKRGEFREDLFYRLNSNRFHLTPLKERQGDLPALVDYFSSQFARASGQKRKTFFAEANELLVAYSWPGNVRELRNFVERLYILTPGQEIHGHDLHFAGLPGFDSSEQSALNFREARSQFEKEFLMQKIHQNQGNISKTAESIGLERSYLHRKIKAFGLDVGGGDKQL